MRRWIIGLVSHAAALAIGFALGVYFLPILTAPAGPERVALVEAGRRPFHRHLHLRPAGQRFPALGRGHGQPVGAPHRS